MRPATYSVPGLVLLIGAATVSCGPPPPAAPALSSFSVSPSSMLSGERTAVTWSFGFENAPNPEPVCSIEGVGRVTDGAQSFLTLFASTTFTLRCVNEVGESTRDVQVTVVPTVRPILGTFTSNPTAVVIGSPTSVTWTWTYGNTPVPDAACQIDNGVGPVTSGAATTVTLSTSTVFNLICTNLAGSSSRQITISAVPAPVAPAIATFTATPSIVTAGVPATLTWRWTYSTAPAPAPACSIDQGVGPVTIGSSTNVTLLADRTYTLTCGNSAGSQSRQVTVTARPPVTPAIATFVATPSSVPSGVSTSVTWTWTYSNTPDPAPTCNINQGIGTITSGTARSINIAADTVYTLTCTNLGGSNTRQVTVTATPPVAPAITTFTATPSSVASGTPTSIQWSWTYSNAPSPAPTCSIDQGVGAVTSGQSTVVTQTAARTYTLTCTNGGGSGTGQATITVAIPAVISSFTATPSPVDAGTPTNVTWSWSYSNSPTPAPTCSIEHGVGTVTTGSTTSITLSQARTYQIQCTNTGGTGTAEATIAVNDCAAGAVCGPNSSCVETVDSYTCACSSGYTDTGGTCSALAACNVTPSLCDTNASCTLTGSGHACVCRPGYVGNGTSCTRARITFITSTSGTGNLSTWSGAGGQVGLAAADAVCQTRAAAAGLPGTYVAWLSSTANDAYCRVHGLSGRKANLCGQASLPVAAGPWVSVAGVPFAPRIDRLLAPTLELYTPAGTTEFGVAVAQTASLYTATDTNGVFAQVSSSYPTPCSDWTTGVSTARAVSGLAYGGGTGWTRLGGTTTYLTCNSFGQLRCMEVGSGPALPPRRPASKRAFLTSVTGTGNISTWAGSGGATGLTGADAICRQRARLMGFPNAQGFKAWMSTSTASATARFTSNGPWHRLDGVLVAQDKADLIDGAIRAPIFLTETGQYLPGANGNDTVWTGTTSSGSLDSSNCSSFGSSSSGLLGAVGQHDFIDNRWSSATAVNCSVARALYCLED